MSAKATACVFISGPVFLLCEDLYIFCGLWLVTRKFQEGIGIITQEKQIRNMRSQTRLMPDETWSAL